MKDLFVYTADADALAVLRSVLARPQAIAIRPITYEVDRHTGRDSGMVKDGPELVRLRVGKSAFQKVLLIWDRDGSGLEDKSADLARSEIQLRLNQVTWKDRSETIVLVPELEEWLWHNPASLARHLGIDRETLRRWADDFARKRNTGHATCTTRHPKELFQYVLFQRHKRKPLPRDFEQIARRASLVDWQASQTFAALVRVLRTWFPA